MGKPTNKEKNSSDNLRMRIISIKKKLKGFDYTPLYQYEYGSQPTETLNKIRMVWNLREVDQEITERLEKIAKNIKTA